MTKRLLISLALLILFGCDINSTTEQRIYVVTAEFVSRETLDKIPDSKDKQYFSKEFWSYFAAKFPQAVHLIFSNPVLLNRFEHNKNELTFGMPITPQNVSLLRKYLPEAVDKSSEDSSDTKIPNVTNRISEDYSRFIKLVKTESNLPIFICTQGFLQQINSISR